MTSVNGLGNGIDYSKWQGYENLKQSQSVKSVPLTNTNYANDQFVSINGETCTDGKDDGKIGLFGAIGNAIKGIGKTAVNMVKGCFTNSEGKFSIGKTLLTVATGAACVAFPAVGLVACGIGAVTGAVQVGKGIYNAATATTDAEAKLAWQDVGGGALTTGLSVAGGKASYDAVMKTTKVGAMAELANSNPNAGILAKGQALAKDMWSSTTSRASNIWGTIKSANPLKKPETNGPAESPITPEAGASNEPNQSIFSKIKSDLKDLQDTAKIDGVKVSLRDKISVIAENFKFDKSEIQSIIDSLKLDGVDKNSIGVAMNNLLHSQPALIEKYGYENILAVLELIAGENAADKII